ncbi:hypothetical protein [Spongiactinospora sp. TRM90649]|uniref:hypothetical protein n=1 Tax=Spongiactinospora sp. TRM90649 TaxID=3031114 RepID=UPI0023F639FD|nr:hypothetical protein [Spongiactinospora sp. TRM90649]MDF5752507.1 hypothetical protein [Spongiactinospora sp. TRM90649]
MQITFPLPGETRSVFVVAAGRVPRTLGPMVPWRMRGLYRRAAVEALGASRLSIRVWRVGASPWRGLGTWLSDGEEPEQARVRRARRHVVVAGSAPLAAQPGAAQMARATARAVAGMCDGVLIDPLTASTIFNCDDCPGERSSFALADDWLTWRHAGPSCLCAFAAEDAGCPHVVSRGLRRFGLPEIVAEGAACSHALCTSDFLRSVAEILLHQHFDWLRRHPAAASCTIGDRLLVDDMVIRLSWLGPRGSVRGRLQVDVVPSVAQCVMVGDTSPFAVRPLRLYGT